MGTLNQLLVSVKVDANAKENRLIGRFSDTPKLTSIASDITWLKIFCQNSSNIQYPELSPRDLQLWSRWKSFLSHQVFLSDRFMKVVVNAKATMRTRQASIKVILLV